MRPLPGPPARPTPASRNRTMPIWLEILLELLLILAAAEIFTNAL